MERKPSLFSAANDVERMMFEIDNAEGNLDAQIVADFTDLRSSVGDAVDRCLYRLGALDMYMQVAQADVARAKEKLDKLEHAKESLERYVMACAVSVTFPLKGERGEFTVKENPGKVAFTIPVKDSKSFTNVLGDSSLNDPLSAIAYVEQRFLERVEIFRIRKDEVLKALKAGEKLPFATLLKERKLEWKKSMSQLL